MMRLSMFPRDLFSEMERLQHELQGSFDLDPSIRGMGRGGFPAMNIGTTPHSVEVYAFMPGLEPDSIEVNVEQGVLTIAGERKNDLSTQEEKATIHIHERFSGRFRKVISLTEDVDLENISAQYRDGVLHISLKRREAVQPRRISVH